MANADTESESRRVILRDRACLQVGGAERAAFLQGLLTNDALTVAEGGVRYTALLTPQGKILADFFLVNAGDVFILDCAASGAAALLERLAFYKLRSEIAIGDVSQDWRVGAAWGETPAGLADASALAYEDPRVSGLGWRGLLGPLDGEGFETGAAAYDAMRIGLAIPECGKDYEAGETFPHEACLDILHGIDFRKGCYVGQEIVSRMEHRGTARTRVFGARSDGPLPAGKPDITADGFPVGKLGSVCGHRGIALARADRVRDSMRDGQQLSAGGTQVMLSTPEWAPYTLEPRREADTPA